MAFADTFKALGDPVRRQILEYLKAGPMSAGEIAQRFSMAQATVSYHLSILRKSGLILETRDKNFIYYELNISVFEDLMLWISQFRKAGDTNEKS